MGISLNEVFPFLSGDGKFSGITKMEMMASLGDFQISILRNDGVTRGTHNFTRRINRMPRFWEWPRTRVFYLLKDNYTL